MIEEMIEGNPKNTQTLIQRELRKENINVSTWLIAKVRSELDYMKLKFMYEEQFAGEESSADTVLA